MPKLEEPQGEGFEWSSDLVRRSSDRYGQGRVALTRRVSDPTRRFSSMSAAARPYLVSIPDQGLVQVD
jgi:hypothetical protein